MSFWEVDGDLNLLRDEIYMEKICTPCPPYIESAVSYDELITSNEIRSGLKHVRVVL